MSPEPFPSELLRLGPLRITSTWPSTLAVSVVLVVSLVLSMQHTRLRGILEMIYEALERQIRSMTRVEPGPLIPLVITLWLFIGVANLAGLVPGVLSPTGDLSMTAALAVIALLSGHVLAFRARGWAYLKQYLEPVPFLLPFNLIGEASRTLALSLRLFGNALSGNLIAAILVYLAGALVPVPILLLNVLSSVVQAYIFGVLTLVFAASAMEVGMRPREKSS